MSRSLYEIEQDLLALVPQIGCRIDGLIKDILEKYECDCGRPPRIEDLLEHDRQDVIRYLAFRKLWTEMANHPNYDHFDDRCNEMEVWKDIWGF